MNSEDLCIGEYKQSRRNNCRGAAFRSILIWIFGFIVFAFLLFLPWIFPNNNNQITTTLPPHTILVKKYPDFYYERIDINGDKYYEGVSGTTIMKIYIGNVTVKKKEKPELSRKR